jgi:hypothetical protein
VYELMHCVYTLAVVESTWGRRNLWFGSSLVCIPSATEPYACVPQANRCSSKARFVDAALPVLMQAFRLPDQEHCAQPSLLFALSVPSTAQGRQIVLFEADQRRHATNRRQVMQPFV